jgi:hypothetical protein
MLLDPNEDGGDPVRPTRAVGQPRVPRCTGIRSTGEATAPAESFDVLRGFETPNEGRAARKMPRRPAQSKSRCRSAPAVPTRIVPFPAVRVGGEPRA